MSFFRSKTTRFEYDNDNIGNNDPLAVIFNEGQWKLSKVSPMYNLQHTTIKFKQYASKIRQEIASTVTSNVEMQYTVQMDIQPALKYLDDDPEGILITVSASQKNNTKPRIAYLGILLSWGVNAKVTDATHLPYLLERGEQRIRSSVKICLQTMFDCNITQYTFTQQQLLHFAFRMVENDPSRSTDALVLSYTTPQVEIKNKITLNFELGDVRHIWHKLIDQGNDDIVNIAYQLLQNQIFDMAMFDISILDLVEVATPKSEVKYNGIVKMKTPEIVNVVFAILNDINNESA